METLKFYLLTNNDSIICGCLSAFIKYEEDSRITGILLYPIRGINYNKRIGKLGKCRILKNIHQGKYIICNVEGHIKDILFVVELPFHELQDIVDTYGKPVFTGRKFIQAKPLNSYK